MLIICAFILCSSILLLNTTHASSHQPVVSACIPDCEFRIFDKDRPNRRSKVAISELLRAGSSNAMNFLPSLSMKSSTAPLSQKSTPPLRSEEQVVRAVRWEERIGRASAKGLTMYLQSFAETILLFFAISLVLNLNLLTKAVPVALTASHPFSKLRNWIVSAAASGADWANVSALYAVRLTIRPSYPTLCL